MSSGDFDERVFLLENAEVEIGTPRKINQLDADREAISKRHFEEFCSKVFDAFIECFKTEVFTLLWLMCLSILPASQNY